MTKELLSLTRKDSEVTQKNTQYNLAFSYLKELKKSCDILLKDCKATKNYQTLVIVMLV